MGKEKENNSSFPLLKQTLEVGLNSPLKRAVAFSSFYCIHSLSLRASDCKISCKFCSFQNTDISFFFTSAPFLFIIDIFNLSSFYSFSQTYFLFINLLIRDLLFWHFCSSFLYFHFLQISLKYEHNDENTLQDTCCRMLWVLSDCENNEIKVQLKVKKDFFNLFVFRLI